jgi:hypothetical protein
MGCGDEAKETRTVTVEREVVVKRADGPPTRKKPRSPELQPAPAAPQWVKCDRNIEALAGNTTCEFAQNTFWTYWTAGGADSFDVWSPAAQSSFTTSCSSNGARVVCSGSDDGKVRFPEAAVAAYSQEQAGAYAAKHDLGPDPYEGLSLTGTRPSAPEPAPVPDEAPPAYEYDEPPPAPGENIPNYENGRGYRVQCEDGTYSQSGGIQGACSWHGGLAD